MTKVTKTTPLLNQFIMILAFGLLFDIGLYAQETTANNASQYSIASETNLFNPREPEELIRGTELPLMNARFSPDGEHIAFTGPNHFGLWVADYSPLDSLKVQNIRKITNVQAGFDYKWSLDGEWILSTHHIFKDRKKMSALQLYGLKEGTHARLSDYSTGYQGAPEWLGFQKSALIMSRNGLVRAETGVELPERLKPAIPNDLEKLVVINEQLTRINDRAEILETLNPFEDEEAKILNLRYSPDGKKVVFELYGEGLYIMNSDGEQLRYLGKAYRADWSPDSRYIVAMVTEDNGYAFTKSDLVVYAADEIASYPITEHTSLIALNPHWSPYGDAVIFNDPETGHIYLMAIK
jgi:hypothetical protein